MNKSSHSFGDGTLHNSINSNIAQSINGLDIHYLDSGEVDDNKPLILLLHGFPELAYSWRKIIVPLSQAGYRVIAPDQRGFGRTTGWDNSYTNDLSTYSHINLVRDMVGLVYSLGYDSVECVIGHDSGAGVAGWASIIRPDIFKSVILMSAPFAGPPSIPFDTNNNPIGQIYGRPDNISEELASLKRPRKHYQHYYRTPEANKDMTECSQGVHSFLRGYYHYKSADWQGNKPFPLESWTASELEKMPTYYIMDLEDNMAQTVEKEMPTQSQIDSCKWLTETELSVYAEEYSRTGFQGGLNWYRRGGNTASAPGSQQALEVFSGKKIDTPSLFIAGKQDWGPQQRPGALSNLQNKVCSNMKNMLFIDKAGHWVQQEQPEEVCKLVIEFLKTI